jgi:hypothetical protein
MSHSATTRLSRVRKCTQRQKENSTSKNTMEKTDCKALLPCVGIPMATQIPLTFRKDILTVSHPCNSLQADFLEASQLPETSQIT